VKFKIDENLPIEIAELLQAADHDATTVNQQALSGQPDLHIAEVCLAEGRVLVTLDLDFSDVRVYPPDRYPGFMVLRVLRQDKPHVMEVFRQAIALMHSEVVEHRLWIVEETRVRIRGEEG
jgi:predicted nuclease of predicted toxin-antitoxin system